jgi:hypothetical protein
MNLYLISQTENNGYDTYDSAVVCAPDMETARNIIPGGGFWSDTWSEWASCPENVTVKYLGVASEEIKQGIVCSSYNAG